MRAGLTVGGALLLVGLVCALYWAGCSEGDCPDCLEPEPCPSFLGTYVGQQGASLETCDRWYLVQGEGAAVVTGQEGNHLELEIHDSRGLWGLMEGDICNTSGAKTPRRYPFSVYEDVSEPGEYNIRYTLAGVFVEGAGGPHSLEAMLTIQLFGLDTGDEACSLSGPFSATKVD